MNELTPEQMLNVIEPRMTLTEAWAVVGLIERARMDGNLIEPEQKQHIDWVYQRLMNAIAAKVDERAAANKVA